MFCSFKVLNRATRPAPLEVEEALHTKKTPTNNRLNCDGGYELPGCALKKLESEANRADAKHDGSSASTSAANRMGMQAQEPCHAMPIYRSVPRKHPWALNHKPSFFTIPGACPVYWALTVCNN